MDGGSFGGKRKKWTYHYNFIFWQYVTFIAFFYAIRQFLEYENLFTWGKEEHWLK